MAPYTATFSYHFQKLIATNYGKDFIQVPLSWGK